MEKMDRLINSNAYATGTTSAVVTVTSDSQLSYYLSVITTTSDVAGALTVSDGTTTLFKCGIPVGPFQVQFPHGLRLSLATNLTFTVTGTAACSVNVVGAKGY